jgi:transcriptional regulator with XRE-family HTH domain
MAEALRRRHMGKVIRAFRNHPHHGRSAIPQSEVAAWSGITQAQLSRIENGPPVMHLDRLTHWARVLAVPQDYLWFSLPKEDDRAADNEEGSSDVKRNQFLRVGGLTIAGMAAGPILFPGKPVGAITEQDCQQWLAWELWHRRLTSIHESEVPVPIAVILRDSASGMGRTTPGFVIHDTEGQYSFAHPSFLDFFVAQRIFENIIHGGGSLFATAQTSHDMDRMICKFVSQHDEAASSLRSWMVKASSAVLRVNSAGVLAKLGPVTSETDLVIASLKRDEGARQLYLTAVASRILVLPWDEASSFTSDVNTGASSRITAELSSEKAAAAAHRFSAEALNPRDGGARWCSTVFLSHLRPMAPEIATAGLQMALQVEPNSENLRSLGATLSGNSPVNF